MRKLIDIPHEVFVILTEKAKHNGVNLKRYIEDLLCDDAGTNGRKKGFNFSMEREPTDNELKLIMKEASEVAAARAQAAENAYFLDIRNRIAHAHKK